MYDTREIYISFESKFFILCMRLYINTQIRVCGLRFDRGILCDFTRVLFRLSITDYRLPKEKNKQLCFNIKHLGIDRK